MNYEDNFFSFFWRVDFFVEDLISYAFIELFKYFMISCLRFSLFFNEY